MKLNQLEIFVTVVETGSFSAAAVELGCTQSRVSHAIAELESELGTRLLNRSHAGSLPSDAGHRVLEKARQMLRLKDSLLEAAKDSHGMLDQVRIACFRSVGTHLLPHALEALALDYPGLRIEIDDGCEERGDVTRAVLEGRADIGIAQLPVSSDLVVKPYLHDSYVFVAPAALKLATPLSWQQFGDLPFIQLGCSGAAAIVEHCRAAGFTAVPERTLANDTSIAAMVARGMGYSILPRLATFPEPDDVRIVDLPIPANRDLALVALPQTMRSKAVKIVSRFICDKKIIAKTKAFRSNVVQLN